MSDTQVKTLLDEFILFIDTTFGNPKTNDRNHAVDRTYSINRIYNTNTGIAIPYTIHKAPRPKKIRFVSQELQKRRYWTTKEAALFNKVYIMLVAKKHSVI